VWRRSRIVCIAFCRRILRGYRARPGHPVRRRSPRRFPSSLEVSHGVGARGGFGYQCGLIRQFRCLVLYPMRRRVQHFENDLASGHVAPEM
jgi:hypothetical protein